MFICSLKPEDKHYRAFLFAITSQDDRSDKNIPAIISRVEGFLSSILEKKFLCNSNVTQKVIPTVLSISTALESDLQNRILLSELHRNVKTNVDSQGLCILTVASLNVIGCHQFNALNAKLSWLSFLYFLLKEIFLGCFSEMELLN